MQEHMEISFEEILKIVRALPEAKKELLRNELNRKDMDNNLSEHLRVLMMNGPVATEKQLGLIEYNRNMMGGFGKQAF